METNGETNNFNENNTQWNNTNQNENNTQWNNTNQNANVNNNYTGGGQYTRSIYRTIYKSI